MVNGEAYNGKLGGVINNPNPNIQRLIEIINFFMHECSGEIKSSTTTSTTTITNCATILPNPYLAYNRTDITEEFLANRKKLNF